MISSKRARAISKILFILGLYNFLPYLLCVRSYAWSKGHSDLDLGSVFGISIQKSIQIHLLLVLASMKLHHFAFFDTANLMKRHIGGLGLIFSAKTGLCLMRLILLAGALEYSKNLIHYLC